MTRCASCCARACLSTRSISRACATQISITRPMARRPTVFQTVLLLDGVGVDDWGAVYGTGRLLTSLFCRPTSSAAPIPSSPSILITRATR